MRFDARHRFLAAAALGVLWGVGCDDVMHVVPADPQPTTGEVWGRTVGSDGQLLPVGDSFQIGDQTAVSVRDGSFHFTDVQPPYDLVRGTRNLGPSDDHDTTVYEGVTRPDPVVRYGYSYETYGGSALVTGRVPYVPRWHTRIIVVTSDGRAYSDWAQDISSAYDLEVRWDHGETNRVTLYALRYDKDYILKDRFIRFLSLKDDERRVVDLDRVIYTPTPTVFLNGSIRVEPYTERRWAEVFIDFGRETIIDLGNVHVESRFPDAFSMEAPHFPGAIYRIRVHAEWNDATGYYSATEQFRDVRVGGGPIHAMLYRGPELLEPLYGATEVDPTAPLRWRSNGSPGVYVLSIWGFGSGGWNQHVLLYTMRTDVVLSEIPALQWFMRPHATYDWSMIQLPNCRSVDEVLVAHDVENANGSTSARRFQTRAAVP